MDRWTHGAPLFNITDLNGLHIRQLQLLQAESTRLYREEDASPSPAGEGGA